LFEIPRTEQRTPSSWMDLDKENKQPNHDNVIHYHHHRHSAPRFRKSSYNKNHPRSRHNSNRVSVSIEERDENNNIVINKNDVVEEPVQDLKLNTNWTVYYMQKKIGKNEQIDSADWAQRTHKIAEFGTVTKFWQIINHLPAPHNLFSINGPSIMIFRNSIQPEWDDPENENGGIWKITLSHRSMKEHKYDKTIISRLWYELLVSVVGESLVEDPFTMSLITGIIVARKNSEDRIQIWTKNSENAEKQLEIGNAVKSVLKIDYSSVIEYHSHAMAKVKKNWSKAGDDSLYRLPSMRPEF